MRPITLHDVSLPDMTHTIRSTILTAVVLGALLSGGVVAGVYAETPLPEDDALADKDTLAVELEANGDASISLILVYDLTSEEEQAAFESLREDQGAMTELSDRFHDRMQLVAESVEGTDEEAVTDAANEIVVTEENGYVSMSVSWNSLGSVDEDTIQVTEPFASGFESDTQFILVGPEDSAINSHTPEPDETGEDYAVWAAGSSLDGFEATLDASAGEDADTFGPGFGVGAAILGILLVTGFVGARSR